MVKHACFIIYGSVNSHNCREWSDHNPGWIEEVRIQNSETLNVWAGILLTHLVIAAFENSKMTAVKYFSML